MIAFYMALVCGRRMGPTDTTLFVVGSCIQLILFSLMIRAVMRWRQVRNLKRLAVAITSVLITFTAAYHPATSPRSFYDASLHGVAWVDVRAQDAIDNRPHTLDPKELRKLEEKFNSQKLLGQPEVSTQTSYPLSRAHFSALPIE